MNHVLNEPEPRRAIESLQCLPSDMPSAYKDVLERINRNNSIGLVRKILSWLFHARRPMLMSELREALSVQRGDKRIYDEYLIESKVLIECCENLVELDSASEIVRFTHYTVQEFLQKNPVISLLSVVEIARTCWTYLNFEEAPPEDDLSEDVAIPPRSFQSHAVEFWAEYTRGDGEDDEEIQECLEVLLSDRKRMIFGQDPSYGPLHIAAGRGLSKICQKLLDHGVSISDRTDDGETALHLAAWARYKDTVDILLANGADACARDHRRGGWTVMDEAADKGDLDTVKALLRHGADPSESDSHGWTALHLAARHYHSMIVKEILEHGANASPESSDGTTPLHLAARPYDGKDSDQCVTLEILLMYGADITARDRTGDTALDVAVTQECEKAAKFLREHEKNSDVIKQNRSE